MRRQPARLPPSPFIFPFFPFISIPRVPWVHIPFHGHLDKPSKTNNFQDEVESRRVGLYSIYAKLLGTCLVMETFTALRCTASFSISRYMISHRLSSGLTQVVGPGHLNDSGFWGRSRLSEEQKSGIIYIFQWLISLDVAWMLQPNIDFVLCNFWFDNLKNVNSMSNCHSI